MVCVHSWKLISKKLQLAARKDIQRQFIKMGSCHSVPRATLCKLSHYANYLSLNGSLLEHY